MKEEKNLASESSLRVAIGGLHRMLKPDLTHHNWAAAFAAVSETHVVAAYDRVAATREEFQARWRDAWGDIPMYDDFPGMIEESRPDILMLSTGHWNHADHIELAVRAGVRGILCEKPFVTSMAEADRILATCTDAKVPLAFGLDRRWSDDYLTLRALLSDGAIGTVTGVAAFGVPNLINHGCHSFDTALALAGDGEPTWASGFVDKLPEDEPPDSHRPLDPPGRGWIGLDNGTHLVIAPESIPRETYTVHGTRGRLVIVDEAPQAYLWQTDSKSGRVSLEPRTVDIPPLAGPWPSGPAAVRDLVQAVLTGGTTACDLQEAMRTTEIGFAIRASDAANGARVAIPLVDRTHRVRLFEWGNN